MREFEILARGCYQPAQLVIAYDPALTMPSTPSTHEWLDALWQRKLVRARERGIRLFDAPVYRLSSIEVRPDGTLHLLLGNTTYKEYVTTRDPEFATGREPHELGNPLSTCSVIETSDDYILLDKRQDVDVYEGRYHTIGGAFERGRDTTEGRPDPFKAIRREIREETGVQEDDIAEQYCLGAVYDLLTPHSELCFLTRLRIPLSTVHTRTPEDDEIKQLHTLAVTAESLRAFILEHHGAISATGEPNLLLYSGLKFGEAWFEEIMHNIAQ
ncbi:MAG: NUDIX hydrolase [Ktedonobacteraceae bacterium]|nr:NUDIX hydrolase [Ktedonobacteraceae bacterium]